jgi:hypothetical protein
VIFAISFIKFFLIKWRLAIASVPQSRRRISAVLEVLGVTIAPPWHLLSSLVIGIVIQPTKEILGDCAKFGCSYLLIA